jgi:hypothetical protein
VLTLRGPAWGLVALAGLASSACATKTLAPSPVLPPLRAATLAEVAAAYDGFCRDLVALSGQGDLEVRDRRAGKARRLGVRVLAARGGRLYVKGSVAVVTALEVVADGRRFWFRVPSKRTIWTGAADAAVDEGASAEEAPYYALRPADLVEALLPEALAAPGSSDALVLDGDRETFALTEARLHEGRGPARRRILFDRATLTLSHVRTYDPEGSVVREARYSDWRDGLPRRVAVARPREGYEAEFVFENLRRNPGLPERAFAERPAEGYALVEVR